MSKSSFISILVVFFFATGLFAQLQDTVQIQVISITSTKNTTEKPYKKQEIDSVTISQYATRSIAELISNETPLFVKSYGQGSITSLSFRGTGSSHTQMYWNGLPVNSPVIGMNDVSLLPMFFSNDLELHYGLSSLVDGTGGLGGAIQLNNNPERVNKFKNNISIEAGSYGFYYIGIQNIVKIKNIDFQTGFFYKTAQNDFEYTNLSTASKALEKQQNSAINQQGFYQNIFYNLNAKNRISLKYNYFDSDRELPKLITQLTSDEKAVDKTFRSVLEWQNIGKKYVVITQLGYWIEKFEYEFPMSNIFGKYSSDNLQYNINYKKYFKNNFTLNAQYNVGYTRAENINYLSNVSWLRNAAMISLSKTIKDKIYLNGLIREELNGVFVSPLLPSFGVKYHFLKAISVKANIAKSYRAPSFNDLYWKSGGTRGNPDLVPENGWATEVGLELKKNSFSAQITGFYSAIDNWIIWLPEEGFSSYWSPQNEQHVINKGVELMGHYVYSINKINIKLSGLYTYTSSATTENNDQFQLMYVPFHQYKISTSIQYLNFDVHYNHVYTGQRYITTDNNWFMPDYQIGNLSLDGRKEFKNHIVILGFNINNIWNKEYQSIAWRPMPGRNFSVKLNYIFTK